LLLSSTSGKPRLGRIFLALMWIGWGGLLTGCEVNDFFNPGEPKIIGKDSEPLVRPILDTLASGIEEPSSAYSSATDITPEDLIPDSTDYQIGPNDMVQVSITDLMGEGTGEYQKTVRVTETGMISLPFIDPIRASGLTEHGLELEIEKVYEEARLIRAARVAVTVTEPQARQFSIQGNVGNPGQFVIPRNDFRMLDALVLGRGPSQAIGVDYAYVIRKLDTTPPPPPSTEPSAPDMGPPPGTTSPATQPSDLLTPPSTTNPPSQSTQSRGNAPAPAGRAMLMDQTSVDKQSASPAVAPNSSHIFTFDDVEAPTDVRIIRVPIDQLRQYGELKYNIVIRPWDMIVVPDPETGVYYVGGHVLRSGVYSLSGVKVDLKQAWVSAGGADDFAIPARTEVIRRLGTNKEVFVRVDMAKVWSGEQPDLYLKPNDIVEVGTDFIAPFLAAGRNSFRLTYGFGFLYDRNFYNGPNGF
jgi:polysaccharide biosynthesis/export protein